MCAPAARLTAEDVGWSNGPDEEGEDDALDVLDLPQLYTRPNTETLLLTLADLSSQPASWEALPRGGTPTAPLSGDSTLHRRRRKVRSEGVPAYLTKIVASPLAWIDDEQQKERIWETAAQRLSERSGRTAMGSLTRSFVVPLHATLAQSCDHSNGIAVRKGSQVGAGVTYGYLDLSLHEPALTGDDLGLKTWASSFLLAKRLAALQHTLPRLPQDAMILELGSGTGLVGLAAAGILGRHCIMTDLAEIVPNLDRNAKANAATLSLHGGSTDCAILDWTQPGAFYLNDVHRGEPRTFPLILAADPIYSPEHPRLFAQAVSYHLMEDESARVIVEMPLRDAYAVERHDFRAAMSDRGLALLQEGEESGFDDWSSNADEDLLEVRCWWSVWRRR